MSGISSVGSYNPDLYYQQLDQALSQQDATAADTAAAAASQSTAATADDAASSTGTSSTSGTTSLQDQVRTAIISAVQQAENSGDSTDLLTVIAGAVTQTLQNAGIDPSTAADNSSVDPSTKALLTVLGNQAQIEAETTSILDSLDGQSGSGSSSGDLFSTLENDTSSASTDPLASLESLSGNNGTNSSSSADLFSTLQNQNTSQSNQDVLGYLLDTQQ